MVDQIALDENNYGEAITPAFAERAINRARDAIHAARDKGPRAKAATDLEELALRYMDAMRLWLLIHRAARARAEQGQ
jgi:hypothetical protein